MTQSHVRYLSLFAAAVLTFPSPTFSFASPLSDTAVRQAYFMGQRHDETLARLLGTYVKPLPVPATGPYISSVTFFTPYALLVQQSGTHPSGYSAQQAEIDHRHQMETVQILIKIQLTDSYAAVIRNPNAPSTANPTEYIPRPTDFWRDFEIKVISEDQAPYALKYSGEPDFVCGDGGCTLVGATIELEFPAEAFTSDSATVRINPPEGEEVVAEFDLTSFR
jgi:hypothetical protein